jgi:hypothetical protein
MQEPFLIGYRGESLLGKKMILRSTSLFREKKTRKFLFCSEKLCSEKGFVFKIFEPPSELVFEEFNVESGDALSGFRATLFFRVFKKPRNKRGEGGMGRWRLENS